MNGIPADWGAVVFIIALVVVVGVVLIGFILVVTHGNKRE